MKPKITTVLFILWLTPAIVYTQDFTEIKEIFASDSVCCDCFGVSIDISGNYAVIGANYESEDASGGNTLPAAGSAYIFKRNLTGSWNEVQKIVASDRDEGDLFGSSVSISGNYIVVGTPLEDEDTEGENTMMHAGSAYIFKLDVNGSWFEVQKIVASDRGIGDQFGSTVSISGNHIIIGAASEEEDEYGGNTLPGAGSAYIFECDASGNWNEVQKIVASDRDENDVFGWPVDISGNYAVVVANREDEDATGGNTLNNAGSAYIFECDAGGNWNEVQKIVASDRDEEDYFGWSVSISEDYIIIGVSHDSDDPMGENSIQYAGSAYIFERNTSGNWYEAQKIVASDREENDFFGAYTSISGNHAIVTSPKEDEDASGQNTLEQAGSAYIFERNESGIWNQIQKIVPSDREDHDYFGTSVALSGDYAFVGIQLTDPVTGSVYIFESCTPETGSDPENIIENGDFEACELSPWWAYNHQPAGVTCDALLSEGKCTMLVFDPSSTPYHWHVQLNQGLSTAQLNMLEKDATYNLSFDARAVSPKTCRVSFERDEDPWTTLLDKTINIGTETQSYSYEFTAHTIWSVMKLTLQVGIDATPIIFDNVRLVKVSSPPSMNDTEKNAPIRIFPNPASENITIQGESGSLIRLINILGTVVKTATIEHNQVIIPLDDVAKGIYFIEIDEEGITSSYKVIIQ